METPEASAEATPSPEPGTTRAGSKAVRAKVIDTDFRPTKLTVQKGVTVEWTQVGDQPHSVTAADGSFDSSPGCGPLESDRCLEEGDSFSHTFSESGEFLYYCSVHGLPDGTGMTATIVVE